MGDNFMLTCETKRIWLTFSSCNTCADKLLCKKYQVLKMSQEVAKGIKESETVNTMEILCEE